MRRLFTWILPLTVAIGAAAVFGSGFVAFLRGDTGTPVNLEARQAAAVSPPHDTIAPLILGDSLARGTGDDTGLGIGGRLVNELQARKVPSKGIVNIAVNGERTLGLIKQLESPGVRRLIGESNLVIVSIGGNDLWGDNFRSGPPGSPDAVMEEVLGHIETIIGEVRKASPRARVFLIGLYNPFLQAPFGKALNPFVNRWNARVVERFANDPNVTVVQTSDIFAFADRLSADRFHPSGEGYARIARRIADAM